MTAPEAAAPAPGLAMQLAAFDPARAGEPFPPVSPEEWEARARAALADGPFDYVAGGAGAGDTMRANRAAFDGWRLWPHVLRDVSQRSLGIELFGHALAAPVLLAPIGVLGILHADAELAPARAAARAGVPFTLSSVSSVPLERVAEAMEAVRPGALRWFQLYPSRDRTVTASLVARAERAGYQAIVVTLDTPMLGWREADLRNRYLPFLRGDGVANYLSDPAFRALCARPPEEDPRAAVQVFLSVFGNPAFSWADLDAVRQQTRLPILAKGVLHPHDVRRLVEHHVDGIVVSNHGGRQVDGAVAALDALPSVAAAARRFAGERFPVLFDSGVRRGADVLKALALGARAVLFGRPYAYALAAAGEAGVAHALACLVADLDLELALSGRARIAEVDRSLVDPDLHAGFET